MRYKLFCTSCMVAVAVMGAAPAYADTDHGVECGGGGATSSPGNAATSPGSVFNEPGTNSLNGGKGNQAYNTNARTGPGGIAHNGTGQPGAPAQYDVACGKVTANGAGTPMQEPPTPPNVLPTDITNNARDTRAISHTGKGANK